jgi:hypothetical protein
MCTVVDAYHRHIWRKNTAELKNHLNFPVYNAGCKVLTHETTCASEMLEKTTGENFCQKRPPTSGGTPGQATRGPVPAGPYRRCRYRHVVSVRSTSPAANGNGGMLSPRLACCRHVTCRQWQWRHVATTVCPVTCRQRQWRQGPAGIGPGGT